MKIELWPIDRPKPYPKNARKWGAKAVEKIAASLREFGFRQPLVVDKDGVIVIGHLRLAGAKHLGLQQVPVHVAADLSPEQIKALRLADNRLHEEANWIEELIGADLFDLKLTGFDLSVTGFESLELDTLMGNNTPDAAEDECPEPPEAPVSVLGDLWQLGPHRLLCGDSTDENSVSRLLSPTSGIPQPFLMVTDPPYGVEYEPEWRDKALGEANRAVGKVAHDDQVDWSPAWRNFPGGVAYVWHAGVFAAEVAVSLLATGFQVRAQIVWAKQHFAIGRGAYHWQHEPCWYAVRKGSGAQWRGDRKQSTLWQVNNGLSQAGGRPESEKATGHGTQKPVELMRRPILNHTVQGEAVYDPFLGSGSTLIAAELTGRVCYGLEIDPKYVDVILTRWQNQTGKEAVLADGPYAKCTFEHAKQGRLLAAQDAIKEDCIILREERSAGQEAVTLCG